ncbi:MAG: heme A synthase [Alphaproteobacteria bacterium]|nr:heme A synthase [Alphaproteobacteria bacterium]
MVFAMVVIGGLTRLTESGLSIVRWQLVTGTLPPLSEAAWQEQFDAYRATPEFQKRNFWMGLDDFKSIFWLEYLHRLWGRMIGLVFALPFAWFLFRGRLDRPLAWRLGFVFSLGALQGALGWFMVASGLVDRPDVSHYRLAMHLLLALVIYGLLLRIALGLRDGPALPSADRRHIGLGRVLLGWIGLTLAWGAFVAGLDAGAIHNTFPLMGEGLIPPGAFAFEPWPLNLVENPATVQFIHRVLGTGVLVLALALWLTARGASGRLEPAALGILAMAAIQVGLGIATLLTGVALALGVLHQAGAVVLLSLVLWYLHLAHRRRRVASGFEPAA